ncbi:MAG: gephyrin-like molybdotransferase Glp [Pseudomonadota bacterium]
MSEKPKNCMDDFDPDSLSLDQAVEKILAAVEPVNAQETISISSALNRIAFEPLIAKVDVPSFCSSAMDGYAFRAADWESAETKFTVVGKSFAGHPYQDSIGKRECVTIMTGAALPDGTDSVVMQERADRKGDEVSFSQDVKVGQFSRAIGSDTRSDTTLINAGTRLTAAHLALLASQGYTDITVYRKLRVAIVSTGDELVQAGLALSRGQIYDSNRELLAALLREMHVDVIDAGVAGDSRDSLEKTLDSVIGHADVIISSGGVSVGEADFVRPLLEAHGDIHFWKIAMKPGRPLTVARYKGIPFYGLPGNPVSVAVTFQQLVTPAIAKMSGTSPAVRITIRVRSVDTLRKTRGRIEFQRGILRKNKNGELVVETTGLQDSHVLSSLVKANCYVILPLESNGAEPGDLVDVQPICASLLTI